jgi:DNA polymerase
VPRTKSLSVLAAAAQQCEGCQLYRNATQAVLGEGSREARVVLVGEQPGDREDLEGAPFVGPAGALLDRALADAGLTRREAYLTNAVKHFKWEPRGKRRIHKKPRLSELRACRPWLDAELRILRPSFIVCLGATAAQALLGPSFRLMAHRGRIVDAAGARILATIHPSAVLRAPDRAQRAAAYATLVADLRVVATALKHDDGMS